MDFMRPGIERLILQRNPAGVSGHSRPGCVQAACGGVQTRRLPFSTMHRGSKRTLERVAGPAQGLRPRYPIIGTVRLPLREEFPMNEKTANVHWEGQGKQGQGTISTAIGMQATVPGISEATFQEIANAAKRDCPLSKALASVPEITLKATLR
jgi:hypothetical protein